MTMTDTEEEEFILSESAEHQCGVVVVEDKNRDGSGARKGNRKRKGKTSEIQLSTKAILLSKIAKIASVSRQSPDDALSEMYSLLSTPNAAEFLKDAKFQYIQTMFASLNILLPLALKSREKMSIFLDCLEVFEDHEDFVLPVQFYRRVAFEQELETIPRSSQHWKRRREERGLAGGSNSLPGNTKDKEGRGGLPIPSSALSELREHLCMEGMDYRLCHHKTLATTIAYALLKMWPGSEDLGKALFDQAVLEKEERAEPVWLGLETLFQVLMQFNGGRGGVGHSSDFHGNNERETVEPGEDGDEELKQSRDRRHGEEDEANRTENTNLKRNEFDREYVSEGKNTQSGDSPRANTQHPLHPPEPSSHASAMIVGNYFRAEPDTCAAFFQDILPFIMLCMPLLDSCRTSYGQSWRSGQGRVPVFMIGMLRALVDMTKGLATFNMRKMVESCVKEAKMWGNPLSAFGGDPYLTSATKANSPSYSSPGTVRSSARASVQLGFDKKTARTKRAKQSGTSLSAGSEGLKMEKNSRRALVLSCLDILGPSAGSRVVSEELIEGETRAVLRMAVAEAVQGLGTTWGNNGGENNNRDQEEEIFQLLHRIATDSIVSVRLAALAAVGKIFPLDSGQAGMLLLERCLDVSSKVRKQAVRLLVDEFGIGTGAVQGILASAGGGKKNFYGRGEGSPSILSRLLCHWDLLEETDSKRHFLFTRFPFLLNSIVASILKRKAGFGDRSDSGRGSTWKIDNHGGLGHSNSTDIQTTSNSQSQWQGTFLEGVGKPGVGFLSLWDSHNQPGGECEGVMEAAVRLTDLCMVSDPRQYQAISNILESLCQGNQNQE
ncbi:unnamed protein product [Choristocarpus tenellus]